MKTQLMIMRDASDDLLFKMKMLAGSGDLDQAVIYIIEINKLYRDAVRIDRERNDSDSKYNLLYIEDNQDFMVHHIAALDVNNKSRTAREAREYRKAREEMENL